MDENQNGGVQYKRWDALSPKACLLVVHGLGGHTGRWDLFANFFLKHAVTTYAVALRGFGETGGLKGHVGSFSVYCDDIYRLRSIIHAEYPDKKIFLLGESLGGLLAFLAVAEKGDFFDGLLTLSPAFKSRLRFSFLRHLDIFLSLLYNPRKQFTMPFDAQMCTRDTAVQEMMNSDASEHRQATARMLFNIVTAQFLSSSLACTVTLPVLFLIAGRDMLIDPGASTHIFEKIASKDKTIIHYPEMYHALSIDLGREKVFGDILEWIGERI
ncbi:MAG: alpha/beta fold hydrolase [Candidatus Omnitrophica bacterium]|nr:alpha/beta fold hydrolase [Candidatus Omnitrophota bacterium]